MWPKALVLLLYKLWLSCTYQMYSWVRPKYHVTHIIATYLKVLTHFSITHMPLISLRKSKASVNVIEAIVPAKSWSINVPNVISRCTIIVYRKENCCFNFYSILDLVHKIFGSWNCNFYFVLDFYIFYLLLSLSLAYQDYCFVPPKWPNN